MKNIPARKILLTLLLVTELTARAGGLYQQPTAAGSGGHLSARFTVTGSNADEFVWDSFTGPVAQTLREIQWRGSRSGATPADFDISINTAALPGGTTWHIGGNASETPTSTPDVYDYRFTLPTGFMLTGGQTYWLQIIATQNKWPNWLWSAGNGGNGTHYAQMPAFTGDYHFVNSSGDVAFTLPDAPNSLRVSWPATPGGWVLQENVRLAPTNWTPTSRPTNSAGGMNHVAVPISSQAGYFRLIQPCPPPRHAIETGQSAHAMKNDEANRADAPTGHSPAVHPGGCDDSPFHPPAAAPAEHLRHARRKWQCLACGQCGFVPVTFGEELQAVLKRIGHGCRPESITFYAPSGHLPPRK